MDEKYLQGQLPAEVMARDRHRCAQMQTNIKRRRDRGQAIDKLEQQLVELVDDSLARVAARRKSVPAIDYPAQLPVTAQRQRIMDAISGRQVVIVAGATGSGKTTQLPKLCLELGFGGRGRIGHTQPRRIAARAVAARIADELHTSIGELLGYQVRFSDHCSDHTLIKLMTDGILLAEIQHDRFLDQYDALIIDEAHERSLNIDFLLGYLKTLLPRRPELKVIITSATIDVDSFSRYFTDAPVIDVSGRAWPVAVQYLKPAASGQAASLADQVLDACHYIQQLERAGQGHTGGDILVFLPGERDIRDCALKLRRADLPEWDILPLYARLGRTEQDRVFSTAKRRGRRVVLATNVAETSLTVPGIRYVVDSGLARVSRYSHRSRVQRLPIEAIARASAQQRSGRCGREAAGTCIRLYSEADFLARPEYTESEIHRTNLAAVILQLSRMRLGTIDQFPFIEAPDHRLVRDGYHLLEELGAIESSGQLTTTGARLARIPADPRVARMLLAAQQHGCVTEVLIIAAALSIQDPRERPLEKQAAADQAHSRFRSDNSDFIALVKLWRYFEEQRQSLGKNPLRKLCQQQFLSYSRMFEWRDLHYQLSLVCKELGLRPNHEPAAEDAIHQALLAGLISHVGQRQERREYLGARNRKFRVFPGSHLAKRPPPWIMATELVDTGVVYGRINASIKPEWLLGAAAHLLQRSYSEPHFSQRRQTVMARQKITLYGLVLSDNTRVSYGAIDPVAARELFIRGALVEGGYSGGAGFWRHNCDLQRQITELETRLRRHDLLVDDEVIFHFYDELLPSQIWSKASLDKWRKKAEQGAPKILYIARESLLRRDPDAGMAQQFPDSLSVADLQLPLRYSFAPGKAADGVTVVVPLAALNRLSPARFEWLVPGLLREKCIELLKSLPRPWRKQLVPVPDTVDRLLPLLHPDEHALTSSLAAAIRRLTGVDIPASAWSVDKLDPYYHMHFSVIDGHGAVIAEGRELATLVQRLRPRFQREIQRETERADPAQGSTLHRCWNFGELQPSKILGHGAMDVLVYPALVDKTDGVLLEHCDRPEDAARQTRQGLARLYMLALAQATKYLKKDFLRGNQVNLQLGQLAEREALQDDYLLAVFLHQFVAGRGFPADKSEFEANLQAQRGGLVSLANEYHRVLQQVIAHHHEIRTQLARLDASSWHYAIEDIGQQLEALLGEHFLKRVAFEHFSQYPRYLRGIVYRLQKLEGHQQKDRKATTDIRPHIERLQQQLGNSYQQLQQFPALVDYRYLLEEYRLSLFAQEIGARKPVSAKRLDRAWQLWQKAAVT